ncbi:hypothetical protein AO498_05292 [Algoriphagus sanaruensis]|uniref:Uncharacterized protein n=1 Tax=Algoriphagus sanaruensis TaxID=1727163 RepID=A0A142EL13_9BACT|nr:hypothetical protein AO498_05292 [Algoriphagus sanaruensis]
MVYADFYKRQANSVGSNQFVVFRDPTSQVLADY